MHSNRRVLKQKINIPLRVLQKKNLTVPLNLIIHYYSEIVMRLDVIIYISHKRSLQSVTSLC